MDKTKEQTCSELFDATVEQMLTKMRSGKATAADTKVVVEFLKNNGITAAPKKGTPMAELVENPFTEEDAEDFQNFH